MVLLSILLGTGASAVSDDAIRLAAARCGLKPHQLVWRRERGVARADITPNGELDNLPFKSVACMVDWAKRSRARVGFIAEPPPSAAD